MSKSHFRIAVLGGDGIGPEVIAATVSLLTELEHLSGKFTFDFTEHSVGAGEYLSRGDALPDKAFAACRDSDAVLLGAMGLPDVRYPSGKEVVPQIELRERLQLYGGVRPIRLFHENDTPLKGYGAHEIDFVLVRESTEGLFAGRDEAIDPDADEVSNRMIITRTGAERVCRLAFQIARTRQKRVSLIDKANVLSAMVFFRRIFDEIAREFPDCSAEHIYVDAAALYLVRNPTRFDVMVTENMFGDILSDLSAGIVGGMGMAPSADIGDEAAVFQPAHGSAPDIAGQGIANPVATILSAAMMLEWFGTPETCQGADAIRQAVSDVFQDPAQRTPDMGGTLTTAELTHAISLALQALFNR